jgi:hypothetical protein
MLDEDRADLLLEEDDAIVSAHGSRSEHPERRHEGEIPQPHVAPTTMVQGSIPSRAFQAQ